MWSSALWLVSDVSTDRVAFVFNGEVLQGVFGLLDPWRWRRYVSSTRQELITRRHSATHDRRPIKVLDSLPALTWKSKLSVLPLQQSCTGPYLNHIKQLDILVTCSRFVLIIFYHLIRYQIWGSQQRCCWRFKYSRTLHCVTGYL